MPKDVLIDVNAIEDSRSEAAYRRYLRIPGVRLVTASKATERAGKMPFLRCIAMTSDYVNLSLWELMFTGDELQ